MLCVFRTHIKTTFPGGLNMYGSNEVVLPDLLFETLAVEKGSYYLNTRVNGRLFEQKLKSALQETGHSPLF
jgi:hypothetical protein